jgi:hypothetical protein
MLWGGWGIGRGLGVAAPFLLVSGFGAAENALDDSSLKPAALSSEWTPQDRARFIERRVGRRKPEFCDGHHRLSAARRDSVTVLDWEASMRQHLRFAFAAAAVGLAMIAWARAGNDVTSSSSYDVVRPKVELGSPALNPNLPFQVLRPVY